jgi:hypothetical protein
LLKTAVLPITNPLMTKKSSTPIQKGIDNWIPIFESKIGVIDR